MTGGTHDEGNIGLLHQYCDHSQADISPPGDAEATLSPLSLDGKDGDMKLEDIAGLSLAKHSHPGTYVDECVCLV